MNMTEKELMQGAEEDVTGASTTEGTITLAEEMAKLRHSDAELTSEEIIDSPSENIPRPSTHDNLNQPPAPPSFPFKFVPLRMGGNGRTHIPTEESAALVEEVGGLFKLQQMTEAFYEKAFKDETLDKFLRSRDDPHGRRFATWIHQKLSGGSKWDQDRAGRSNVPVRVASGGQIRVNDRTSAHVAAWHSPKRATHEVGRHFELGECRVWMRLHFWAMREVGLEKLSPSFVDYYVRFLGHFVRVYESHAPAFARESFRWSADPDNIKKYINNGHRMSDVLGEVALGQTLSSLPDSEVQDQVWPYHEYAESS
jgi:hypothetical protein